jgi:hypothetical protein
MMGGSQQQTGRDGASAGELDHVAMITCLARQTPGGTMDTMIRIKGDTHRVLRTESVALQFKLGKPVSMNDLVSAALTIALQHRDELERELDQ